jgi:hypothetical protein
MSVIKKCDVENYLAARRRGKSGLYLRTSPGKAKIEVHAKANDKAIFLSKVEPGGAHPNPAHSAYRSSNQPVSIGSEDLPIVIASDSGEVVVPARSKSAQA